MACVSDFGVCLAGFSDERPFYISSGVCPAGQKCSFYLGASFSGPVSRVKGGDRTLGALVPRRMQRRWAGDEPHLEMHAAGRAGGYRALVRIQRGSALQSRGRAPG